jgi:hypothetical protein
MERPFVIHFHQSPRGDHFDLMIAEGKSLATFELGRRPEELAPGESMEVRRLADHRREYLTYEGEISGGRGSCRIVDRGTCVGDCQENVWTFELSGQSGKARYRMELAADGKCRLTRLGPLASKGNVGPGRGQGM